MTPGPDQGLGIGAPRTTATRWQPAAPAGMGGQNAPGRLPARAMFVCAPTPAVSGACAVKRLCCYARLVYACVAGVRVVDICALCASAAERRALSHVCLRYLTSRETILRMARGLGIFAAS